jgi:hypothetical protein
MKGGGVRICTIVSIVTLLATGIGLFFFSCVHFHNWWSLFVPLSLICALFTPHICHGYRTEPLGMLDDEIKEGTLRTCREVGWVFGAAWWMFAYGIPVLAWYNDGFHWLGATLVMGSVDAFALSYILWLLVFLW